MRCVEVICLCNLCNLCTRSKCYGQTDVVWRASFVLCRLARRRAHIMLDSTWSCIWMYLIIWYVQDFGNPFCTVFAQFLRSLLAELASQGTSNRFWNGQPGCAADLGPKSCFGCSFVKVDTPSFVSQHICQRLYILCIHIHIYIYVYIYVYMYIYIICISILFCRTLEVKLAYAVSTGARYGCHAVSTYARIGCYGDHGVGVGVGRVSSWGVSPCHWDKRSIMKYLSSVDSVDIWFEVACEASTSWSGITAKRFKSHRPKQDQCSHVELVLPICI